MEIRTLIPNLRSLTDRELRELAAQGGDFGGAAAYVLDLRREIAGLVYRLPLPTCAARRGGLRCDLEAGHALEAPHFDAVLDQHFDAEQESLRRGVIPYVPVRPLDAVGVTVSGVTRGKATS